MFLHLMRCQITLIYAKLFVNNVNNVIIIIIVIVVEVKKSDSSDESQKAITNQ
jgi:hypothetical protein